MSDYTELHLVDHSKGTENGESYVFAEKVILPFNRSKRYIIHFLDLLPAKSKVIKEYTDGLLARYGPHGDGLELLFPGMKKPLNMEEKIWAFEFIEEAKEFIKTNCCQNKRSFKGHICELIPGYDVATLIFICSWSHNGDKADPIFNEQTYWDIKDDLVKQNGPIEKPLSR